ncbi:MAG: non-heme iron oxygenase ferredoxin subunit [Chloroflexota bacterium]|nr:non-heme iron oxygenase ferredoxin subunit [Chloroflexota bacterium]
MTDTDLKYETVAKTSDLKPGEMMYVEVDDEPVCLINLNGEFHALNDVCTHQDASLSDGEIDGDEIECPLHGGAFDIRTGQPTSFPVVTPIEVYKVRVVGDDIQVALTR